MDWYYKRYGQKIFSTYRSQAIEKFGEAFFSAENNYGAPIKANGVRCLGHPTFWEFVQYLKASKVPSMDVHWRPIFNYCSTCTIPYKNIFKFENIDVEMEKLKQIIGPEKNIPERIMNPNPTEMTNEELTQLYFQQLSEGDISYLYKVYEFDFKIFGYTFKFRNITYPP